MWLAATDTDPKIVRQSLPMMETRKGNNNGHYLRFLSPSERSTLVLLSPKKTHADDSISINDTSGVPSNRRDRLSFFFLIHCPADLPFPPPLLLYIRKKGDKERDDPEGAPGEILFPFFWVNPFPDRNTNRQILR